MRKNKTKKIGNILSVNLDKADQVRKKAIGAATGGTSIASDLKHGKHRRVRKHTLAKR